MKEICDWFDALPMSNFELLFIMMVLVVLLYVGRRQ
jgi:hypothetical protein